MFKRKQEALTIAVAGLDRNVSVDGPDRLSRRLRPVLIDKSPRIDGQMVGEYARTDPMAEINAKARP
jgi:hypothetical protein